MINNDKKIDKRIIKELKVVSIVDKRLYSLEWNVENVESPKM